MCCCSRSSGADGFSAWIYSFYPKSGRFDVTCLTCMIYLQYVLCTLGKGMEKLIPARLDIKIPCKTTVWKKMHCKEALYSCPDLISSHFSLQEIYIKTIYIERILFFFSQTCNSTPFMESLIIRPWLVTLERWIILNVPRSVAQGLMMWSILQCGPWWRMPKQNVGKQGDTWEDGGRFVFFFTGVWSWEVRLMEEILHQLR